MPDILYHLGFAERVCYELKLTDTVAFYAGNLIPDLAIDKMKSHYRKKASCDGFLVPEMEVVKKELLVPNNAIKFGMYCHLYLDYYFIEEFLIPSFIWDRKHMRVINPRNNKQWDADTFFSQSGMYGAYTEINHMMVRAGHISLETVEKIPEILPNTGLKIFDERRDMSWKEELDGYLAQEKEYTGEIFDYNRLWGFVEMLALRFVKAHSG